MRTTRRQVSKTLSATLLWSLVITALACNSQHDPPSRINKLRIIAARADPPYLALNGSTKLQLKVVGHKPDQTLCYAWAMCLLAQPKDGNFRCLDPDLQAQLGTDATAVLSPLHLLNTLQKLPGVLDKLGIELPSGTPTRSDVCQTEAPSLPVTELYVLFKVAERDSLGGTCPGDANAMLATICDDRDSCLAGYKRIAPAIKLTLKDCKAVPVADTGKHHNNPQLTGLKMDGVQWPADVTPVVRPFVAKETGWDSDESELNFDDGDHDLSLLPAWSEASIELIGAHPDPKQHELKEALLFSWFSDKGGFKKQRTYTDMPENHFQPPKPSKESDLVRLWMVVRDGRNGTDWLERSVIVRDSLSGAQHPLCTIRPTLDGCPTP
jgi:hypothetical protein